MFPFVYLEHPLVFYNKVVIIDTIIPMYYQNSYTATCFNL